MKKYLFAALMMITGLISAATPTDVDIANYKIRAEVYIGMGQNPDQVAVSLGNWFGKPYFHAHDNGWNRTADIQYQIGDGNNITYLETIATMKVQ